ncbi:RHS repeat protein [Amycolatopsis carbonis]|uniref:RHS repeat protein n=1 Tax=Amycolatopsis carbonis TaxID=715471 RepID=A0A9Y2IBF3_9PSEU|nr:RHS repeat domain-containing protein [Amycolatopsis sp. 2-15]WIX76637.1 RHS repeat protein [Amycolatopsis sp. 2-15]
MPRGSARSQALHWREKEGVDRRRRLTQGTGDTRQTFTYDGEGDIATATDASGHVSSYTYDADGNLLLTKDATGTTLTLNDLELFRATGTSSTVGTRFYTFNGQPVAERNITTGLSSARRHEPCPRCTWPSGCTGLSWTNWVVKARSTGPGQSWTEHRCARKKGDP